MIYGTEGQRRAIANAATEALRDLCPVSAIAGPVHSFVPGSGVVVPWSVMGDDRQAVEVCADCAEGAERGTWTECYGCGAAPVHFPVGSEWGHCCRCAECDCVSEPEACDNCGGGGEIAGGLCSECFRSLPVGEWRAAGSWGLS